MPYFLYKSLQMIDQVKAFERQYTTTNSDLTTISTATTCLKSFDEESSTLLSDDSASEWAN